MNIVKLLKRYDIFIFPEEKYNNKVNINTEMYLFA